MKLNAQQREQLRLSLLRFVCEDSTDAFGVSLDLLLQRAKSEGRSGLLYEQVEMFCDELVEKGLVAEVEKTLSPEIRNFKPTKKGRTLSQRKPATDE